LTNCDDLAALVRSLGLAEKTLKTGKQFILFFAPSLVSFFFLNACVDEMTRGDNKQTHHARPALRLSLSDSLPWDAVANAPDSLIQAEKWNVCLLRPRMECRQSPARMRLLRARTTSPFAR